MNAVLTDAARADLKEIARRIAADIVPAARRFTRALRERALEVGTAPRRHRLADGFERAGIRRRLFRDYLIFFRELAIARRFSVSSTAHVTGRLCWILTPDARKKDR